MEIIQRGKRWQYGLFASRMSSPVQSWKTSSSFGLSGGECS
jgi:hypothetical protein